MKSKRIICITGIDGSGKTSTISQLTKSINNCKVVTIWDIMKSPEIFKQLPFKNREQVDQYLSILHPSSRIYFLFHCLEEAIQLALEENVETIILDGYWYKYYASEVAYGNDKEKILSMTYAFPKPDSIFYLEVDFELLAKREKQYSGYESGYSDITKDNFISFQTKSSAILKELMIKKNSIILNAHNSVGNNVSEILQTI